ncbi:MAG: RraA family protein [Chloroflexi bacterium]|nr:RraA family protein [Chloroflexota bacterium]
MELRPGFRLFTRFPRPDPAVVAGFQGAATGNVCDALGRSGALDQRIKPLRPGMRCAGVATTVKARPCDNLVIWKALELAQPGDILVIATGNYTQSATWGDITSRVARARGLGGVVTDGAARDLDGILETGLPVFTAAVTPNSPFKDGPGELNVPVACGGVPIHPGDILVGDADGVVCVPRAEAATVLAELRRVQASEIERFAQLERGELIPKWVDQLLRERGAIIVSAEC